MGPRALGALTLLVACTLVSPALAEEPEAQARLRADLEALTAPEMMGRGADTEGWRLARDHIQARMKALGLEPAGAKGFLSPVEMIWKVETGRNTRLKLGDKVLARGIEFAPLSVSGDGGFEGPVVFVGHGWNEPGWDDYKGVEVRGQVVVMLEGCPPGLEVTPARKAYAGHASKAAVALSKGATGVIFVRAKRASLARISPQPGISGLPVMQVQRDAAAGAWVGFEAAAAKAERAPASHKTTWRALGYVELTRHRRVMHNVIGRLPGSPKVGAPVILGAHYDGLGLGWLTGEEALHPGADDNASGVAMVLEVARQMVRSGAPPKRPVWFVAFSGEELGMRGSRALAGALLRSGKGAGALLVNADMIGKLAAGALGVLGDTKRWSGAAGRASKASGVEVAWGASSASTSDHTAFVERGMDALHLTTGVHVYYHSPRDVLPVVDIPGLARVARWVTKLLEAVSGTRPEEK